MARTRKARGSASASGSPRKQRVDWHKLESKWQKKWADAEIFQADPKPGRPKFFVTVAYPYVNSPQHIGHGRTYTMADVDARYHRMRGENTLFPMGFHYTGTPIAAMSKRLKEGDHEIRETFIKIYHVPPDEVDKMVDPLELAKYFHREIKRGMKEVGFSIDWRREFSTVDPLYKRFIQWQFHRLRDAGRITRGTHPVGWCPNDNGPVGMHDTMGDVEPEIGEYFLVKFEQDGVVLPTATLRPETVFGVTNLWVNPDASYVQADVDGERWIISKPTVLKLQYQNRKVTVEKEISGKDLMGTSVFNPIARTKIPIFPGSFVDAKNGTGVVMSVPGHAPYDYQALDDLKSRAGPMVNAALGWNEIKPISIIQLGGYSEYPAADVVKKFHVQNQDDPKLENATKEVYSAEFHRGIMKENAGAYSGMNVAKARDAVVQDYAARGLIARMYEIQNRPVICRCQTEVIVKILVDQWFIDYGEPDWKKLAHECLDKMTLVPEEIRAEFNYAIDWLKEKACARHVGLGTPLPWDKSWVIESLSDSTVYMCYYILAKYLKKDASTFKEFEKDPDKLMDEFFDYIFLGRGSSKDVATISQIPLRLVESIRKEFEYFYPVDMRHSAKELIPNHFSFYIFNHVALLPREDWPKGIAANGHVLMAGQKMSKSLQNIVPLREAVEKFGADPVRVGVLATAELGQDTDFSEQLAQSIEERLSGMLGQAKRLSKAGQRPSAKRKEDSMLGNWMLHRLNEAVRVSTEAMDQLRVREVIQRTLYQLDNDLAWYQRRLGSKTENDSNHEDIVRTVLETRARLLAPIAPHTSEEIWSLLGGKGFVSSADWPSPDAEMESPDAEQEESLVKQVMEDTSEILKATGIKPSRIAYYTAPEWKWRVYLRALEFASNNKEPNLGEFIKTIMVDSEMRSLGKQSADYAGRALQQARQLQELRTSRLRIGKANEVEILDDAAEFYGREFRSKVSVYRAGAKDAYDPKDRARTAEPYRPAIFVE